MWDNQKTGSVISGAHPSCHMKIAMAGVLAMSVMLGIPEGASSSPAGDIKKAGENSQSVFVLVTDKTAVGTENARKIIKEARGKAGKKKAVFVELDRDNSSNRELVDKYGLSGAPVPLILVMAPNGAIAGGMPSSRASSDLLVRMVPTPKKAEILGILQSGKAVCLNVAMKDDPGVADTREAFGKAREKMNGKLGSVYLDKADPAEVPFLAELRIDRNTAEQVTIVINAAGQMTGGFRGPADADAIVAAANKKGGGGCCPAGSKKSCAVK